MKKLFKTIWSVVWPIGVYLLITAAVEFVYCLYLVIRELFETGTFDMNNVMDTAVAQSLNTTGIVSLISMIVFAIIVAADRKKYPEDREKIHPDITGAALMMAVGGCLAGNMVLAWTGVTTGDQTFNELSEIIANSALWIQILVTVFLAPITEELLFRGIVYKKIERSYGFLAAAVVSSLLFGVLHGNVSQFIYAFFLGLLFSYGYYKSGHLWLSILMHVLANACSLVIDSAAIALGEPAAFYIAAFAVGVILLVAGLMMINKPVGRSK